jgi:lysophospholipase L1-like esterase
MKTILFLIAVSVFSFSLKNISETEMGPKKYTYLALGDSYTIGEMLTSKENFPNQLANILRDSGYQFDDPEIIAKTGWTTDELQNAINSYQFHSPYDLVTLLIGVNNQYRGRRADEYQTEFESLLKQAIQFANGNSNRVIVLSIPDWGATPYAEGRDREQIAKEIDEYNSVNRKIAAQYNVQYIDITPGTRKASTDPGLIASDGLHPSAKEYSIWAKILADIFKRNRLSH